MKKIVSLMLALTLIMTYSCKKDDKKKDEPKKVSCLVKKVEYNDSADANIHNTKTYEYNEETGIIKKYTKSGSYKKDDGTYGNYSYVYKYIYEDESKGLLDAIEIYVGADVGARLKYTNANDKVVERKFEWPAQGGGWYSIPEWIVGYTYDGNGKVTQIRIQDNKLDNQGQPDNPTDETGVLTYTGDNNTNTKWYDTTDINGTVKEELTYTYDSKNKPFSKVKTNEYAKTSINNLTGLVYNVYGASPSSQTRVYSVEYNGKDMPTKSDKADDRGTAISSTKYTYLNCD